MTTAKKAAKTTVPEESAPAEAVKPAAEPKPAAKKVAKKASAAAKKVAAKPVEKPEAATQSKAAKPKAAAKAKLEKPKVAKPKTAAKAKLAKEPAEGTAKVLDSQVVYEGSLFRVQRDHIVEPGGHEGYRDLIKHNGSVVILAVDEGKKKKDPWVVIERQYRHAAGQFLWELPAGKLDGGENPLLGAQRELAEETGYSAKKWSPMVEYFASPGFLGESMKVFLAEGLVAGDAHPEEDEKIDFRLVKLSELLEMVDKGKIIDGKTLTSVLLYARKLGVKRK